MNKHSHWSQGLKYFVIFGSLSLLLLMTACGGNTTPIEAPPSLSGTGSTVPQAQATPTSPDTPANAEELFIGSWTGSLVETGGDSRTFEATMTLEDQGGGVLAGGVEFHLSTGEISEVYDVEGIVLNGFLQLTGSAGQFFQIIRTGQDTLLGTVSWECFECPAFAELTLNPSSLTEVEPLPLLPSEVGGEWITLSSDVSGNYEVYRIHPDGTELTQLSNSPTTDDLAAQWSPDGSTLAYVSFPVGGAAILDSTIFVMNADGSDPRPVTTGHAGYPVWSPDGQWIAYANDAGLFAVNPSSGTTVHLVDAFATNLYFVTAPSWSPDGTLLAFHAQEGTTATSDLSVFVVGNDGSGYEKALTIAGIDLINPVWISGDTIIYLGRTNNGTDLVATNLQSGEMTFFTEGFFILDFAISPNLGAAAIHEGSAVFLVDLTTSGISLVAEASTYGYTDLDWASAGPSLTIVMDVPLVVNSIDGSRIELPVGGNVFGVDWQP